jgi:hypothetical protein
MKFHFLISTCFALIDPDVFINKNIEIVAKLETHTFDQNVLVVAQALKPTSIYNVAIPIEQADKLAFIVAKAGKTELSVSKVEMTNENVFYNVKLLEKVSKGESIQFELLMTWVNVSTPYPKVISQDDPNQSYLYVGNHFFYSPFKTNVQKLTIR